MLIVLLVLAIWVLISFIIAFPLAEMMHIGSGKSSESLLTDDEPASKGPRRKHTRTRTEPHPTDLQVVGNRKM